MTVSIRVYVVGLNETILHLEEMDARAKDFTEVLEQAKQYMGAANAANFASGGLLAGGWAPRVSPAPWPLMIRTSKLMSSLSSLDGPANVITPFSAEFGTDVEYAHFHQSGTRKMASRKIVFEPSGFAEEVGKMAVSHITGMGDYFA